MKNKTFHENLPPVDISEAKDMLKNARRALYKGRIISAEVYARQAKEIGLDTLASYENAVERLFQTKKIIERASLRGIDTERAMDQMNKAIIALNEAQYNRVPEFCRMAFLACQPEPEPGRDFSLEMHFHGVQVSDFEMVYNLTITVANQTSIPIEDLTIKVPEEIGSFFEARNSKKRFSVKGNDMKRITFVFEPHQNIDDFSGHIMGRDIEVKTTLTTHEDTLVYMVELINTSQEVISSISISPPYRKGYIPSPESYTFSDIQPNSSELAHFKLSSEVVLRSEFSRPESEKIGTESESGIAREDGLESDEQLVIDTDQDEIVGSENDSWVSATPPEKTTANGTNGKEAIPGAHTGQEHIGIWGRNLPFSGSRQDTSSSHHDHPQDTIISTEKKMDIHEENKEVLDRIIDTSSMNNPFIQRNEPSKDLHEEPSENIHQKSTAWSGGTPHGNIHVRPSDVTPGPRGTDMGLRSSENETNSVPEEINYTSSVNENIDVSRDNDMDTVSAVNRNAATSENNDWMMSDDDLIPFTAIRKSIENGARDEEKKSGVSNHSYHPLPPDPDSLDSRVRDLLRKVTIEKHDPTIEKNSSNHQKNQVDTTNQK